MIINKDISEMDFCPYIDTEKDVIKCIVDKKDMISNEYELMPYPLAHWINTIGVDKTNSKISKLSTSRTRIFVCQHILVDKLMFSSNDLIFTPHSSINDKFISIPHKAVNYNKEYISTKKTRKFSFLGSSKTHDIRSKLIKLYPDKCFDSGKHWGLEKDTTDDFKKRYMKMIGESSFSLCPRGTGISTVRLFESILMNSIPVIISDNYKKPLEEFIDWNEFSITIKENEIDQVSNIIDSISEDEIDKKRSKLEYINEVFFNNRFDRFIEKNLIK